MNSIRRYLLPILWLTAMTAGAAPVGDVNEADGPATRIASPRSANAPESLGASPAEEDAEAIMRRVRAIIEGLKRQGPPPVDCMEG